MTFGGKILFATRILFATALVLALAPLGHAVAQPASLGGIYRETGKNPDGSMYLGMVAIVPEGGGLSMIWWIGKDRFDGSGELKGNQFIVTWTARDPAIYNLGDGGILDGEWAGGAGRDRLQLFAPLGAAPAPDPRGEYRTNGINPNGSLYTGTVAIKPGGSEYQFAWKTGSTAYRGTARRQGNLLIVDWGSEMPMIYALNPDGTLKGLFDAGRGSETLMPLR